MNQEAALLHFASYNAFYWKSQNIVKLLWNYLTTNHQLGLVKPIEMVSWPGKAQCHNFRTCFDKNIRHNRFCGSDIGVYKNVKTNVCVFYKMVLYSYFSNY